MKTVIFYRLVFEDGFSDWTTDKDMVLEWSKAYNVPYEWKEVIC